ncbi:MAG: phosphoenolpyruvate--protein phosphotransferase [Chloroflexi bacterium]|nr:phosphoenolpyruvate--protein phosphotransferase [Chloroflexota bacterium]
MVGLVLVSHSRALASALSDLLHQVAGSSFPLAIAAGVGDERSEFGTDAVEIADSIQSVYSPDGVIVLMDLGSAILSAQMALELLPPEIGANVHFCPAPIVEGSIAAAVQIGLGSDPATICREAELALTPKQEQIGTTTEAPSAPETPASAFTAPAAGAKTVVVRLINPHGLHARPAARFVQAAASFDAKIDVRNLSNQKGPVSARSLNGLATLGAVAGHDIEISASGPQADTALERLSQLVEEGFGETAVEEQPPVAPAQPAPATAATPQDALPGVPISEGVALGPLYRYEATIVTVSDAAAQSIEIEQENLNAAIHSVINDIQARIRKVEATVGKEQADIFQAHLLILQDPDLLQATTDRIREQHENAAQAWQAAIQRIAQGYQELEDEYLRQRAKDVIDIGNQVLLKLTGSLSSAAGMDFEHPVVLYAHEITPTETSQIPMDKVLAILTEEGGPTSHAAILARGMGIPAVSGMHASLGELENGTLTGVDGFTGHVWLHPGEDVQHELVQRRQQWLEQRKKLLSTSQDPAAMKDGRRIEVVANIGSLKDAQTALQSGAEGVGLLRTEFLFLTRQTAPDEEEQTQVLSDIARLFGKSPVIVRTLDIGGDKRLPYLRMPDEANPFLGVRAIRLSQQHPDLFRVQARSILRAGAQGNLRIMVPMVANLDEILWARQAVEQVHAELSEEQISHAWPVEIGIMVEIPSAALLSAEFAQKVDFFSIGTNDLTQYTLAAERGNPALANLADALHPAVLRLIHQTVESAHAAGKWVGVCGELAGDPMAVPVLIGLGVDELSMSPGSIPRAKQIIRQISYTSAQAMAGQILQAQSVAQARQMASEYLQAL